MRSSRLFAATSTLALLTAALVSCGGQGLPQAQTTQATTAQAAPQSGLEINGQIVSVSVRPGTTEADLAGRYPDGRLLDLHADEGYAQLWVPTLADLAPRSGLGTLSLNAQAVAVTASEPDALMSSPVAPTDALGAPVSEANDTQAQGNGAWAGGNGAWAGSFTAMVGAALSATTFAENSAIWNVIDLATGQKLASALGKGVSVAVIDTGLDLNHPAFSGHLNTAAGWDYVGGDATPQDEGQGASYGHGTAVAGVILQVAPNATLVPFRVLNANGQGRLSNVIMAVNAAVKAGAKVINLSLGAASPSSALSSAISSAIRNGVMVVASSGNTGNSNVTYPARYTTDMQNSLGGGLLSVGSENLSQYKSAFSTYGTIDLLAPGEAVRTFYPGAQLTSATGTSFAAPMVSGTVALAMSAGYTDVVALSKNLKASALAPFDPAYAGQLGSGSLNLNPSRTSAVVGR